MNAAGCSKSATKKVAIVKSIASLSLLESKDRPHNLGSSPCTTFNPVVVVKHNYSGACFLSANRRFDLS
jgi:hypothetical protein